jgi:hypothetical protein
VFTISRLVLLDANPLSHTDPRNGSSSDSDDDADGGFTGGDGPTFDDLSPKKFAQNWKKMTGRGPNKKLAKQLCESAEREYNAIAAMPAGEERTVKFLAVGDKFAKAAEYWPGSATEMDALFMAGESHFFADHYWDATKFYEKLVKGFPNNRYLDTVDARRFAIARYQGFDAFRTCLDELYDTVCAPDADPYATIDALQSGSEVAFAVGGPTDVVNALADFDL